MAGGYSIDESVARLSNVLHVLRELVHLACGRLALEPRLEVKYALGDHLHDDARSVSKLIRRLGELGAHPGPPGDDLAALLDRAGQEPDLAYAVLKPRLVAAIRTHLEGLDPVVDEPSLRLLTQLLHRQERHVAELPPASPQPAGPDLGALPIRPGEARALRVMAPLTEPARDGYVTVAPGGHAGDDPQGRVHDLMHAALCAAELAARNSHEHPDMPWDFHVDMARQCWDGIRHAEVCDQLMVTELGCRWGDHPVDFAWFQSVYALDLPGRLAYAGEPAFAEAEPLAPAFDFLRAEKRSHVSDGERWGTFLRTPPQPS